MTAHKLAAAHEVISILGKPVMMLDTCTLLDIIRAPIRKDAASARAACKVLGRVSGEAPDLQLVISSTVMTEWEDNAPNVREEVLGAIRGLNERIDVIHEVCRITGIAAPSVTHHYDAANIVAELQQISTKLLSSAIILEEDAGCIKKAYDRAIRKIPPARQGGQIKDCGIIEHYLALSKELVSAGFAGKRLFVSSNTNDFCHAGKLHPVLQSEFDGVGLDFATNLSWAEFALKANQK